MIVPIWLVIIDRDLLYTTIPTAIVVATCRASHVLCVLHAA
ncbi:MAG TPA: hypothetical protein VGQ76_10535 [Thermoanaerobaculia bacterium]|nr:hypothetical protein [Thermoanaerobaculia bacterium]